MIPESEDNEDDIEDRELQKKRRQEKFVRKGPPKKPVRNDDEVVEEGRRQPRKRIRWEDFDEDDDTYYGR